MMSKAKQLRITVLCEDIAHHRFIRSYLICKGIDKRNITKFSNVMGRNNATVLENYPSLVNTHRSKANHQKNIALLVMIDADNKTVEERLREFDKKLYPSKAELNRETREEHERIAIFVPNRNIETWFHYSFGHKDCDENSDYKHAYSNDDAHKAAEKFAKNICPKGLPDDAPDSLRNACEELKRLGLGGQR